MPKGMPIGPLCGAKKRSGEGFCTKPAMANGRCRFHGGLSLKGKDSPRFKHGRTSKYFTAAVPQRLRERFIAALEDPELLSIRNYVAYWDVRVSDALEKYQQFDGIEFRRELMAAWTVYRDAIAEVSETSEEEEAKSAKVGSLLSDLDRLIQLGATEDDAQGAVVSAIRERVALTEKETRRLVTLRQTLSIDQAYALVMILYQSVDKWVKDAVIRSQIAGEIEQKLKLNLSGLPARSKDLAESADLGEFRSD
jgi:hypothetical protein